MSTGHPLPGGAGPDGAVADGIADGVYRPSMVAAYRANPRGAARTGFDAERMMPRWRWVVAGALLIAATVLGGLLVKVAVGPTGAVAGINGRDVVLAFPNFEPPAKNTQVVLRVGGDRTVPGRVKDTQPGANGFQVTMLLVELRDAAALGGVPDGTKVILDQGTRPLLMDLLEGSDAR